MRQPTPWVLKPDTGYAYEPKTAKTFTYTDAGTSNAEFAA